MNTKLISSHWLNHPVEDFPTDQFLRSVEGTGLTQEDITNTFGPDHPATKAFLSGERGDGDDFDPFPWGYEDLMP